MRSVLLYFVLITFAMPAQAKWLRGESQNFIAYSEGSEKDLRDDMIRLERFDALFRQRANIDKRYNAMKLTVFFLRNLQSVKQVHGGGSKYLAGFYTSSLKGAIAVVPRVASDNPNALNSDTILFHEYAHHVMRQYFTGAYPAWYVEGFAELMSTTTFDKDGKPKLGLPAQHRAHGLLMERVVPIRTLLTSAVSAIPPDGRNAFYGRSWLLTHYLNFAKERQGQLTKYLKDVAAGKTSEVAAEAAFGDLGGLQKDLDRYLTANRISYLQINMPVTYAGPLSIAPLSKAEDEAMMARLMLMRTGDQDEAQRQAVVLRPIAAREPQDANIQALLAEAEYGARQWDAAVSAADAALKLAPDHAQAHLWKGAALSGKLIDNGEQEAAKWKQARASIIRANRLATESAAPLVYYFDSFARGEGVRPPAVAIDGLAKAFDLLPQDSAIRMRYAFALANQKRFAEAANLLSPLANDPHGGGPADSAKRLMDRLKKAAVDPAKADIKDIERVEPTAP